MKLSLTFAVAGISLICKAARLPATATQQTFLGNDLSIASTIRDILIDNKVIGDVLDDFDPEYYIGLTYPKHHEAVLLGNDLPVDSVSDRPVFTLTALNPLKPPSLIAEDTTFTLALTDPDAKSRDNPKWSEMCHWIITNLTTPLPEPPPPNLWESHVFGAKPGELAKYLPPGPPPKTGPHRYVFVLLQGDPSKLKAPKDRKHWGYKKARHGVRDWAEENGLTVVGANFFFSQNAKQ